LDISKNYKTTVIILVNNLLCCFVERIESVLGQNYDNKEILIIKDGYTDRGGGTIEKYKKSNTCIKVFKTENQVLFNALFGSDDFNRELLRCIGCGIELGFKGNDEKEEGYVIKNRGSYNLNEGQIIVKVDPKYYRPAEVELLIGDSFKAMTKLGWKPKFDLDALVKEMVASDLALFKKELLHKENDYIVTNES
jgi:hypothetical protein